MTSATQEITVFEFLVLTSYNTLITNANHQHFECMSMKIIIVAMTYYFDVKFLKKVKCF